MKLYKLRTLDGEGLFYTLDMMTNERVHLSTCDYMNDINEGIWDYTSGWDKDHRTVAKRFRELLDAQRFTCFLEDIDHPLMWAHYAGGHSGIAFEYEIDESEHDIRKIDYIGIPQVTKSQVKDVLSDVRRPQDIGVLKQKESYWEYEGEWRLYGNNGYKYINNIKPKAIIFGARAKYAEVLRKIAKRLDIRVGYMVPESSAKFAVEYDETES